MEAIVLAGGKAERLGDARRGARSRSFPSRGGRSLAYKVARLAAAGVDRVIVACAAGQEELFDRELAGLGAEIVAVGEPEPLGRGGGLRFAAAARAGGRPGARAERRRAPRRRLRGAARSAPSEPRRPRRSPSRGSKSPFGVVDLDERRRRRGFREAPRASALGELRRLRPRGGGARAPARARRPRGRRRSPSSPPRAACAAFRHEGLWLTREHAQGAAPRRGGGLTWRSRAAIVDMSDCRRISWISTVSPPTCAASRSRGATRSSSPHTDSYFGKLLFIRKGEQLEPPVPQGEGRGDLRPRGPDRAGDRRARRRGPLDTEVVGAGRAFRLTPGTVHRWRALEDTVVLEASTPELDDVVRLEDRYGRADATT